MAYACKAAAEGHELLMKSCKPGLRESYLDSIFKNQGQINYNVKFRPYGDIVSSGKNTATLHYVENNKIIGDNEFVMCDVGHTVHFSKLIE